MTPHIAYYLVFATLGTWLVVVEIRRRRRIRLRDHAARLRTYEACGRLMAQHGNDNWRVRRTG